jgi:serine/threonine protein kinase
MFHDDLAEEAALKNASASFADVEANGQPAGPLPFPPATIGLAERVDAPVFNPFNDEIVEISDIIYERHADLKPPDRAYWVGNKLANKLAKCIFGEVKSCTILKYRNNPEAPWEVTEEKAVVKIVSKKKIRDLRHVADPRQDVAAMQYLSQDGAHPHVMSLLDVLEDDDYLLLFMPLCSSGDLFTFVEEAKRFEEPMARYWFKQILEVSRYRATRRDDIPRLK